MVKNVFVNYPFSDKGRTIVLSGTCPPLALEAQTVTTQKEFQDLLDNLNAKLTLVNELSFLKDEIIKMKNMHKTEIVNLKQEILSIQDENSQLKQKVTQLEQSISKSTATQKQIQTLHKKVESLEYTTDLIKDNLSTNMINPPWKEQTLDKSMLTKADPQPPFLLKLSNTFEPLARDDKEPKENFNQSSMSNNAIIQPNPARNITSSQSVHDNITSSINQDSLASVNSTAPQNSSIENPDLILLIDSNGRHINMSKLLPRKKSVKVPCPLISNAENFINTPYNQKHPSTVICHFGTNDFEKKPENTCTDEFCKTIHALSKKFPQSRILVSLMLPRIDNLNETIQQVNFQIKRRCEKMSNVEIISHINIEMNKNSTLKFLKNLKNTMYHGTKSRHANGQNLQLHAPQ